MLRIALRVTGSTTEGRGEHCIANNMQGQLAPSSRYVPVLTELFQYFHRHAKGVLGHVGMSIKRLFMWPRCLQYYSYEQ